MKKIRYFYNTHTLRYEKLVTPLRVKILRAFGFIAAAIVTAAIIVAIAFQYIDSPKRKNFLRSKMMICAAIIRCCNSSYSNLKKR